MNTNIKYFDINGILNDVDGRIRDISNMKKTKATSIDVQSVIFSAASLGKQNNVMLRIEIIIVGTITFII